MKPDWLKKILPHVIAIGILLLLAILYCKPVLDGKVLSQNDNIQWQAMAKQSLDYKATHGTTPLWTNRMFGGMPAYQIALESNEPFGISFFNSLFSLWLPKPINFFFLAALGFYFLCSVLRVRPWIGVLGAVAYAFSTYDPVIIGAGHDTKMMAIAYIPAVLAGILLLTQKKYLPGLAVTTLFMSLLITMNHLQVTYYFFLLLGVLGIVFAVVTIKAKDFKHLIFTALLLGVALTISIGVNTMNLWTTYEYSKETIRGGKSELTKNVETTKGSGLDKEYAFRWSYGIFETFTFMVPNLYGGSSQAPLDEGSETYKTLTGLQVPAAQAESMIKAWPLYWGDQPGTSGPVYLGIITCLLAILGFLTIKSWHKWWLLVISILAILMSWGSNLSAFNYALFDYLPFYNKFRAPSMILIIPQLTFAILAVLALQALIEDNNKQSLFKPLKLAGMITGGILALLLLASATLSFGNANDAAMQAQFAQMAGGNTTVADSLMHALHADRASIFRYDLFRAIALAAIAYFLIFYYLKGKVKIQWMAGALVVLMLIDLLQVDARYLNSDNYSEQLKYNNEFAATPVDQQIMQDKDPYFRVFNLTHSDPFSDAMTSYFHNSVGGYHAAKLTLYQDLIENQLSHNNLHVLNMLNAKYVIVPGQQGQPVVQTNPDALGNAWFIKSILWVPNADAEMKALDHLNTRDSVVIDQRYKSAVTTDPVFDSAATIKLVKNDVDAISYTSTSKTPQFAVFSEVYYKEGWKAFIDDKEVPYARVNYVLRGLSIPAGTHAIAFKFEPKSYFLGEKISFASTLIVVLLLIVAAVVTYLKKKKQ
ncbi:membrane protein YfhO [Chitinophaga sp. YR573]|uniref:YfhO family protein n=1 Tax=Chitinophaga sp. YR573 TaxID=1881040 RepID=UPI0008B2164A|nr:YfhO family protein [Chitinophaga sp. YR573]SEW44874.1 membrane protein YfhO [Chitinophaga sp. YR573]